MPSADEESDSSAVILASIVSNPVAVISAAVRPRAAHRLPVAVSDSVFV